MSGTATIEVHYTTRERLRHPPYCDQFEIHDEAPMGDETALLLISSPLLEEGHHGTMEFVLDKDGIRFKRWADC